MAQALCIDEIYKPTYIGAEPDSHTMRLFEWSANYFPVNGTGYKSKHF